MMCRDTELGHLVNMIPDGSFVGIGGFQLNRAPMAIVAEIISQRKSGLRVVSAPNPLPLDALVAAGLVAELECGFIGFQYENGFVIAPSIRRAVEECRLALRERDVYETLQALRAAALGLPYLPLAGTPINDYPQVLEPVGEAGVNAQGPLRARRALSPDIALLHVQATDADGNLRIDDPHADALLAMASKLVIATAEEEVEKIQEPTVPGHRVAAVAVVPGGAYPTACYRYYTRSPAGIGEYLEASSGGDAQAIVASLTAPPPSADALDESRASAAGPSPADPAGETASSAATPHASTVQPIDRVLVAMARSVSDHDVVTTGVGSAAAQLATELARRSSAPKLRYINCVGAIDPRITTALCTSVDSSLLDECRNRITLPGVFEYACRGEVDLMFFGAAQIDAEARINLTCIGPYSSPEVKLAGPAGSPTMRSLVRKVVISISRHSTRTLVPEVDFVTSAPMAGGQSTTLITNLGIFDLRNGRLRVVSRHEGVSAVELREATGFTVEGEIDTITPEPSAREMELLQELDPQGSRYQWG